MCHFPAAVKREASVETGDTIAFLYGLLRGAAIEEPALTIAPASEAQELVADYRHLGLSLGRHPLALLRAELYRRRFVPSDALQGFSDGQLARACGLVTVRQRPATANGVTFLTLEDEAGTINVIVFPDLGARQRRELTRAALLGVYGVWQDQSGVRHLIAKRLVDCSVLLGELDTRSRDFH